MCLTEFLLFNFLIVLSEIPFKRAQQNYHFHRCCFGLIAHFQKEWETGARVDAHSVKGSFGAHEIENKCANSENQGNL